MSECGVDYIAWINLGNNEVHLLDHVYMELNTLLIYIHGYFVNILYTAVKSYTLIGANYSMKTEHSELICNHWGVQKYVSLKL